MQVVQASDEDITHAAGKWVSALATDLQYLNYGKEVVTRTALGRRSRKRGTPPSPWRLLSPQHNEADAGDVLQLEFFHKVLPGMLRTPPTKFRDICSLYDVSLRQPFFVASLANSCVNVHIKPARLMANGCEIMRISSKRSAGEMRKHNKEEKGENENDDLL